MSVNDFIRIPKYENIWCQDI